MKVLVAVALLPALAACSAAPRGHHEGPPPRMAFAVAPPAPPAPPPGPREMQQPDVAPRGGEGDFVVASIQLVHARTEDVTDSLRVLMNGWSRCRWVGNQLSNTVVVVGPADEIATFREVLANLDTPPQKQPGTAPAGH